MSDVDKEFLAGQFKLINERLDAQDLVMKEMATSASLTAESHAKMVDLIDKALAIASVQANMRRDIDELDLRAQLIELHLGMKRGELPR